MAKEQESYLWVQSWLFISPIKSTVLKSLSCKVAQNGWCHWSPIFSLDDLTNQMICPRAAPIQSYLFVVYRPGRLKRDKPSSFPRLFPSPTKKGKALGTSLGTSGSGNGSESGFLCTKTLQGCKMGLEGLEGYKSNSSAEMFPNLIFQPDIFQIPIFHWTVIEVPVLPLSKDPLGTQVPGIFLFTAVLFCPISLSS